MNISMTLHIALRALGRNKMRTGLTMLGIIIGVGAVIAMIAMARGEGADSGDNRFHGLQPPRRAFR